MANGGHPNPKPIKKPVKGGKASGAVKPNGAASSSSKPKG